MTRQRTKTGSSLSQSEQDLHITSLIFLTSKLGLKPFVNEQIVHVKLLSDNTTLMAKTEWVLVNQHHVMKHSVKSGNG